MDQTTIDVLLTASYGLTAILVCYVMYRLVHRIWDSHRRHADEREVEKLRAVIGERLRKINND